MKLGQLVEFMAPQQAAQALTGTDPAARRLAGNQPQQQAIKATAAAIDAEQKSTDPLDRRIAQARSTLAQLLQQKQRLQKTQATTAPATPGQPAVAVGQPGQAAPQAGNIPSTPQVPT